VKLRDYQGCSPVIFGQMNIHTLTPRLKEFSEKIPGRIWQYVEYDTLLSRLSVFTSIITIVTGRKTSQR